MNKSFIISALAFLIFSAFAPNAQAETVKTRFGDFEMNKADEITTSIKIGESSAILNGDYGRIEGHYIFPNYDLFLLAVANGDGCVSVLYIANVSANGMKLSPSFGTCSDDFKTTKTKNGLIIKVHEKEKYYDTPAEEAKAYKKIYKYSYINGVLREGGKIVKE